MDSDGLLTLLLGVGAGIGAVTIALQPARRKLIGTDTGAFVVIALVGVIDWVDEAHRTVHAPIIGTIHVQVGWGLQLVTLASVTGAVVGGVQALALLQSTWAGKAHRQRVPDAGTGTASEE